MTKKDKIVSIKCEKFVKRKNFLNPLSSWEFFFSWFRMETKNQKKRSILLIRLPRNGGENLR